MEIRVHGHNVDISDRVHGHINKRVSRATRFFDRVGDADVELREESKPGRSGGRYRAEITAPAAGHTIRAEGLGDTMQQAVDAAAERFDGNLKKLHDRLISRNRGGKKELNLTSHSAEDDQELDTPEIVRVKQFVMKPMTPDDAALAMEQLGHSFFFFHNAESDLPSVLYNRRDGRLGLIEPK